VSADAFTLAQVDLHLDEVVASIDAMAARRRRHPKARVDIIERLRRPLPRAMDALSEALQGRRPPL
jgi:hypothetical protein